MDRNPVSKWAVVWHMKGNGAGSGFLLSHWFDATLLQRADNVSTLYISPHNSGTLAARLSE